MTESIMVYKNMPKKPINQGAKKITPKRTFC
jgi:hypothetical protein